MSDCEEQQIPQQDQVVRSHPVPMSAMAITALVLGVIALFTSTMPIINNASFFLGLLGALFAIIGLVATLRKRRKGTVMAIISLAVNILACAMVLSAQAALSASFDEAMNGPSVTSVSKTEPAADEEPAKTQCSTMDLAIGSTITLANGLEVTVEYVDGSRTKYDGSQITAVGVSYRNGGSKKNSFNPYDWKGQDSQGVLSSPAFYTGDGTRLSSGDLISGGSVSGEVYFEGTLAKVVYYASAFGDATASWNVA